MSKETGRISTPEIRQTPSLYDQPPRLPARSASQPPRRTPPPKPAVSRKPNCTPTCAGSRVNSRIKRLGAQAPTALSTSDAAATTRERGMTRAQMVERHAAVVALVVTAVVVAAPVGMAAPVVVVASSVVLRAGSR